MPLIYSNAGLIKADDNNLPILEAELTILDDVDLVEFGKESTIGLRFTQSGFNWTKLSETGKPLKDFIFAKIYLPILFNSIIYLLGYNSVVFETEIINNPFGWEAWVSPSSVTYFTGESTADVDLHVKVSRPTTANTATIRIKYTAYSGGENIMGTATTDVLVSIKQYHLAEVNAINQHREVPPDTVVYFPIEVTNRGNYEDTFEFEVSNEINGFLGLVSGHITLKPGETGQISAMILTPYVYLYDFGTQTSLNISAYSVYETSKKFSAAISITSKGFLISEMFVLTIAIIILSIIFIYFIFIYIIDKRRIKIFGKPDKPWKIPSEEKYLQELRKKDKKEYNVIKKMMMDEYQSSLLWYKDNIEKNKIKEKKQKNKSNGFLNKDILKNFFNNSNQKHKLKSKKKKKIQKNKIKKIEDNIKENSNESKTRLLLEKKQKDVNNTLKKFISNLTKNKEKKENLKIKKPPIIKKDIQHEVNNRSKNMEKFEKIKIKSINKIKREEKKQKMKISR